MSTKSSMIVNKELSMPVNKLHCRISERSALAGALLWLLLLLFPVGDPATEFIARLMLLGALVVVPLGLSLVEKNDDAQHCSSNGLFHVAVCAQPVGALMATVSLLLPQGMTAALLASGWLVVTGALSLSGLVRLLSKEGASMEEFAVNAGLSYLFVGGGWLVFSRYGLQPLAFGDTIVLLTAVHFHYAGFAAPLLAGLAGRALAQSKRKVLFTPIVIAVVSGMPLVAAGITFSPLLALVGAVVMASGLVMLALIVCLRVAPGLKRRAARALLIASSISSIFAMMLACVYAYSIVTKILILNIEQMAESHGVANAFGFSLCGLIAWKLEEQG